MKDINSPSGIDLRPEPPNAVRLSKRAGLVALVVVTAVIGLVIYGIATRRQHVVATVERADPTKLTAASDAGKAIASEVPAGVIAGAPQREDAEAEQQLQVPEAPQKPAPPYGYQQARAYPAPPPPPLPATPEISPEERARIAAFRQEMAALSAPTATGGSSSGIARTEGQNLPTREGDIEQMMSLMQAMQGPGGQRASADLRPTANGTMVSFKDSGDDSQDYSAQNMQDRKEAFLTKARGPSKDNYLKSSRSRPMSKFEIKAGWDIPAVLEQSLNSDLPGEIRALVRENVYDTASGDYLLIPQGSRLAGLYDSRIAYGQDGLTVVWNRVIFPDGSSIDLEGMAGQDAQGRAGLRQDVDNHYRRLIGFAILTSGFSAAFNLSQSRRGGVLGYPSAAETAGSAVGAELSRLGSDVTRRNLNVQPTIKVPVGYRFNIRVNRDLLFDGPYRPFRM